MSTTTTTTTTTTTSSPSSVQSEAAIDYIVEIDSNGDLTLVLSDTSRHDGSALDTLRDINEAHGFFRKHPGCENVSLKPCRTFEICGSPEYNIHAANKITSVEGKPHLLAFNGAVSDWSWPADEIDLTTTQNERILVKIDSKRFERISRVFKLFVHPSGKCGNAFSAQGHAELEFPEDNASAMLALIVAIVSLGERQTQAAFQEVSRDFLVEFMFLVDKYCLQREVAHVLKALCRCSTAHLMGLLPTVQEQAFFFKMAENNNRYLYALHREVNRSRSSFDVEDFPLHERDFRRMSNLRLYYLKELSLWYSTVEGARCRRCKKDLDLKLPKHGRVPKGEARMSAATARSISILTCPSSKDYDGLSIDDAFAALRDLDNLPNSCKQCSGLRRVRRAQYFDAAGLRDNLEHYRKWERDILSTETPSTGEERPEPVRALEATDQPLQRFCKSWLKVMTKVDNGSFELHFRLDARGNFDNDRRMALMSV